MKKLEEHMECFEHYEKRFSGWEATETIFDEKRASWMLKDPESSVRKVCMFRDGNIVVIYGDYGSMVFDKMTWIGDIHNMEYDNIGYQMEKLSRDSQKAMNIFDEDACKEDILEWARYHIEQDHDLTEDQAEAVITFISEQDGYCSDFDIESLCSLHDFDSGMEELIKFAVEAGEHANEDEWIAHLRASELEEFDDVPESPLWRAGERINQSYFINMYALKVCREKLTKAKEEEALELSKDCPDISIRKLEIIERTVKSSVNALKMVGLYYNERKATSELGRRAEDFSKGAEKILKEYEDPADSETAISKRHALKIRQLMEEVKDAMNKSENLPLYFISLLYEANDLIYDLPRSVEEFAYREQRSGLPESAQKVNQEECPHGADWDDCPDCRH